VPQTPGAVNFKPLGFQRSPSAYAGVLGPLIVC
jgi:hypothetical protein